MRNFKLTTKILGIVIVLVALFTIALGVYFDLFLKRNYYSLVKERMTSAKERLKSELQVAQENLVKGIDFIDGDVSLIASMELINHYQDKKNYNAILLDEEKKVITNSLLSRVKRSFNSEIRLYDANQELVAYVSKDEDVYNVNFVEKGRYRLNFIAYENSKKILYAKYENEEFYTKSYYMENPDVSFVHIEYYKQPELAQHTIVTHSFDDSKLVIKSHKSIFDPNKANSTILHLEMSKSYSSQDFMEISRELQLNVFPSTDEKYKEKSAPLFEKDNVEDSNIYEIDNDYLSIFLIKTKKQDVYLLLKLDKTGLNALLRENRAQMALFLVISIMIMIVAFRSLMRYWIEQPLSNLMTQILKIQKANYETSEVVKTGDELEEISQSVNVLAQTVSARENSIIESQERLEYFSTHDELTGLLNRRSFAIKLDYAIASAKRNGRKLAILFLDLDQFKQVNDTLGHRVGDVLLRLVAHRLESILRESDVLARVGGDEFNIFIEGFKNIGEIQTLAQKILDDFTEPFVFDENEITSSTSIGIAIFPDDGSESEILIKNADLAMYESKDVGRNAYSFYSSKFSEQMQKRTDIISALKVAIKSQDEFTVHYQPKISIKTKKVVGAEALIRWNSRQLGVVYPDQFIKVAEDTRLIIDIGKWVLEQACSDFVLLKESGVLLEQMSVNVSGVQLEYSDLFATVQDALSSTGILPRELELEVTESYIATNEVEAIKTLSKFRDMGVELAIDDFGTGYSSLSYLQKLPVSRLKIDKAFVDDLPDSKDSVAVVGAIISLAQAFDLKVTVEGVENQKQLAFFEDKNCHDVQGYVYSKPLPLKEFQQFCQTMR